MFAELYRIYTRPRTLPFIARPREGKEEGEGLFRRSQITLVIREFIPGMKSSTENVADLSFEDKRSRINDDTLSNFAGKRIVLRLSYFTIYRCLSWNRVSLNRANSLLIFFFFFEMINKDIVKYYVILWIIRNVVEVEKGRIRKRTTKSDWEFYSSPMSGISCSRLYLRECFLRIMHECTYKM